MIVNQANLHGLTVGYSTAFNKSFDTTQSNYQKVATVVPSTTGEQDYKWLGQMPGMREWIGEREVQALAAYDYLIKNKKFEMTLVYREMTLRMTSMECILLSSPTWEKLLHCSRMSLSLVL